MKLLPSPSYSSSSSTFDPHSCNPRAAATPSCIAGILRRILCSGSLPTHPSDHVTEETNSVKSDDKENEAKPSAGIVARLMGLDSMPEMKQNHNSITRSKSMNSVEHFYKHLEGKHEQVKTTLSFREIPTFLELDNEDYFILSFEGDTESKQFRANKSRSGEFNFKQDKCKNKTKQAKTKPRRFDPEEAKEFILIDLKQRKKSRKRAAKNKPKSRISTKNRHGRTSTRKVESDCSSDELSPVSVLDNNQFLRDQEQSTPLPGSILQFCNKTLISDSFNSFLKFLKSLLSGDSSSKSQINPRRKLSPELEIPQIPSRNDGDLILARTKVIDGGIRREGFGEEICKITEMELGESNWKTREIREELGIGGIIEGFDSYVLEGLIDEFVEQMYGLIFV